MAAFVDPRDDPKPSAIQPPARITTDAETLEQLHRLCREARLYDVERWIQTGRPLQAVPGTKFKGRRMTSALEIAFEARNHALTILLLYNGYDVNLEPRSALGFALRSRRLDLVDLLLGSPWSGPT